jgi:hypothetical protein
MSIKENERFVLISRVVWYSLWFLVAVESFRQIGGW